MTDLPDAPWIRDAEINGMPEDPPPLCPVCGEEAEDYYIDLAGDIIGCENCVRRKDAYEYKINQ